MYGYGSRYPSVRRRVEILYDDPEYKLKWARAAVLNMGLARRNPWIDYLRTSGVLKQVQSIMKDAAAKYRATHPPTEKYKTALRRRLARLEKAKTYLSLLIILTQLPKKFDKEDVDAVLDDLQREINAIKSIVGEQVAKGYGYGRYGLGYDVGEAYGYGYFY